MENLLREYNYEKTGPRKLECTKVKHSAHDKEKKVINEILGWPNEIKKQSN